MRDERAESDMRIRNDRQIDSSDKRVTITALLQGSGLRQYEDKELHTNHITACSDNHTDFLIVLILRWLFIVPALSLVHSFTNLP